MNFINKKPEGSIDFGFEFVGAYPSNEPYISCSWTNYGEGSLVLLADRQQDNHGASLTNCMEAAIAMVSMRLQDPKKAVFVQLDSDGHFDVVRVNWATVSDTWIDGPSAPEVAWEPLLHGEHKRTLDAFRGRFGDAADRAIQLISYIPEIQKEGPRP